MTVCMRCGRDIEEGQVFCPDCLKEMSRYPVDPNTVVQIPLRKESVTGKKNPRRRSISPEEQILILKRRIRILSALTALLLGLSLGMAAYAFRVYSRYRLRPGQNYTSVISTLPPTTADETVTGPAPDTNPN